MKRIIFLALPLVVVGCGSASEYMQGTCANRSEVFEQVFTCTKNKLYNDPLNSMHADPADTNEIVAYGEELNSQVRQHLMGDAQAKDLFAQKLAQVKARHEPAPLPLQPGLH